MRRVTENISQPIRINREGDGGMSRLRVLRWLVSPFRRRPYVLSGGFWSGVVATIIGLCLISGWIWL